MRRQAYWLFEIVAWPAAAWGVFECLARVTTGETSGLAGAALLTGAAAATVCACRWRQANLALQDDGESA